MANYAVNRFDSPSEATCSGAPLSKLRALLRAPSSARPSELRPPSSELRVLLRTSVNTTSSEFRTQIRRTVTVATRCRMGANNDANPQTTTQISSMSNPLRNSEPTTNVCCPRTLWWTSRGPGCNSWRLTAGLEIVKCCTHGQKTSGYASSGSECGVSEKEQQLHSRMSHGLQKLPV